MAAYLAVAVWLEVRWSSVTPACWAKPATEPRSSLPFLRENSISPPSLLFLEAYLSSPAGKEDDLVANSGRLQ